MYVDENLKFLETIEDRYKVWEKRFQRVNIRVYGLESWVDGLTVKNAKSMIEDYDGGSKIYALNYIVKGLRPKVLGLLRSKI